MALLKPVARIISDYTLDGDTFHHAQRAREDADPVIRRIDEQVRVLGMEKLQRVIDGLSSELIDERLSQLDKKRALRCEALGFTPYLCEKCHDTGVARGDYCTCLRSRIYQEHYGAYDPLRHPVALSDYSLDVFDDKKALNDFGDTQRVMAGVAYNIAKTMVESLPDNWTSGLFIHGEPGLGKSWLAGAIAREAAQIGVDTAFIHAVPFFQAYYRERLGYDVDTSYIETARLLIVDDLGAEPMTANVTVESLLRVINGRIEKGLPTVFASNESSLLQHYGERVSSRICGSDFIDVRLRGGDLRSRVDLS